MAAFSDEITIEDNIWIAAGDGNLEKVKKFLEGGQSVDAQDDNGYTAMHAAASYGEAEVIRYLLSVGANVNIRDTDGDTPLHTVEQVEIAKLLLENNADLNAKNLEGKTARDVAIEDERSEVIVYLSECMGLPLPIPGDEAEATGADETMAMEQNFENNDCITISLEEMKNLAQAGNGNENSNTEGDGQG